jgi:hypothetical protein
MIRWNDENNLKLIELVGRGRDVSDGLRIAAREMNASFYVVRNRWYSDKIKELRGDTTSFALVKPRQIRQKRSELIVEKEPVQVGVDVKTAIQLLHEAVTDEVRALQVELERVTTEKDAELEQLKQENSVMAEMKAQLEAKFKELENEYNIIFRVINKAREISVKEELGEVTVNRFKMDQNGNLEPIRATSLGA